MGINCCLLVEVVDDVITDIPRPLVYKLNASFVTGLIGLKIILAILLSLQEVYISQSCFITIKMSMIGKVITNPSQIVLLVLCDFEYIGLSHYLILIIKKYILLYSSILF